MKKATKKSIDFYVKTAKKMGKLLGNTHAWKCSEQVKLMNEAKNLLNQQQFRDWQKRHRLYVQPCVQLRLKSKLCTGNVRAKTI